MNVIQDSVKPARYHASCRTFTLSITLFFARKNISPLISLEVAVDVGVFCMKNGVFAQIN